MVIQRKQNYGWPDCTHWNDSEILGKLGQGVWCRENKVGDGQGQEENSRSEKETSESQEEKIAIFGHIPRLTFQCTGDRRE